MYTINVKWKESESNYYGESFSIEKDQNDYVRVTVYNRNSFGGTTLSMPIWAFKSVDITDNNNDDNVMTVMIDGQTKKLHSKKFECNMENNKLIFNSYHLYIRDVLNVTP